MKKTPIALILTDTHLHKDNIELVTDIWKQAVNKCQELGIKNIYFGGDFFTARQAQPLEVDDAGRNIINSIPGSIHLTAIPGNHDKTDLNSTKSYLDEYENHPNVFIIKDHRTIHSECGGVDIHFIPYFKENTLYPDYLNKVILDVVELKKLYPKTKHILLTHIAVNGVRNNDNSKVENNLNGTLFSHFDSVLIGHYHNQSFIEPNIYYIGSPYQANFGEDNAKGFTILYSDGSHEFIKSTFPEYVQVRLDVNDAEAIKKAKKKYELFPGYVRFVFEGTEADLKNIKKEKFAELGIEATFNKDSAQVLDGEGLIQKATSVSFDRKGIDEAFETFCKMNHIEDNSIGKSYLEKI